jgi:signal transduction histidine kinase
MQAHANHKVVALRVETDEGLWTLIEESMALAPLGIEAFLERFLSQTAKIFGADGASLFLGCENTFALAWTYGASSGIPSDAVVTRGQGIAGFCIQHRIPMWVSDPTSVPELHTLGVTRRDDLGSAIVVPLSTLEGKDLGVICMNRRIQQQAFARSDLGRARGIARHLAMVLELGQAQSDLVYQRSMLTHLVESVPYGAMLVDSEGIIQIANKAFVILGAREGAHVGTCRFHLPEEVVQLLAEAVASPMNVDQLVGSPERRWSLRSRPGDERGVVVTIDDVTDAEREAAEQAKLRHLAEIGFMTSTLAHEIRNPLTGIRAAAQLLASSPDQAESLGEIIDSEARRLDQLCTELLEFAKPVRCRTEATRLEDIAESVVRLMEPVAREKGVSLLTKVPKSTVVELDRDRIRQVLQNLVRNALDASKPGGTIRISGGRTHLTVSDDGIGMTREQLEQIGTPFYTTKLHGTGLGLATIQKVLEAHGAGLRIRSQEGRGSVFSIRFCVGGRRG